MASYQEIGLLAVAVRVTFPGPQFVMFEVIGTADVLFTIACTAILLGQEPTSR